MGSARVRSFSAAAEELAARHEVVAAMVVSFGLPRLGKRMESHYGALVQSIVYQQLAGAAAATIHGRLLAALGGDVRPEVLLALPSEDLRAAGLSGNKAASLVDLSTKVLDGTVVLDPRGLARESDDEVVERLTTVRGIGRWTAEMFLMFELRRLDVWPTGDLGVRRGFGVAFSIPMPSAKELEPLGDRFRPYRSVVAWYCWRSAEQPSDVASPVTGTRAAKAKSPASKKKAPAAKKKASAAKTKSSATKKKASAAKTKSSATKKKSSATKKKSRARSG